MSRTLKLLRSGITHTFCQRQKLLRLVSDNPDNVTKYNTRMSFLHQNSAECETVLKIGMESQKYLLESMVRLRGFKVDPSEETVVLSEKGNCFQLLPPDVINAYVNLKETDNARYIKQRTVEWDVLRSSSRVTGSTLNCAIGLDTLARQKQHHYEFVCGHGRNVTDPLHLQRLNHGAENEVNIIATLITYILPAYLHPCYAFFEVGPVILHHCRLKIVVSADGILQCPNGNTCINYKSHGDKVIALEFKSPYPTKENPNVTVYEPSPRHVPQLLLEMKAWKCDELWLLCGILQSVTLMRCYKDVGLTDELIDTADYLYGSEKPPVPTRLHPRVPTLKNKIREYIKTHTCFICEAPSIKGSLGNFQ